jgi:hypothetical protein
MIRFRPIALSVIGPIFSLPAAAVFALVLRSFVTGVGVLPCACFAIVSISVPMLIDFVGDPNPNRSKSRSQVMSLSKVTVSQLSLCDFVLNKFPCPGEEAKPVLGALKDLDFFHGDRGFSSGVMLDDVVRRFEGDIGGVGNASIGASDMVGEQGESVSSVSSDDAGEGGEPCDGDGVGRN